VVTDNFGSGKLGGSGGSEEVHEVLENELACGFRLDLAVASRAYSE
jgi:hypothetical protein